MCVLHVVNVGGSRWVLGGGGVWIRNSEEWRWYQLNYGRFIISRKPNPGGKRYRSEQDRDERGNKLCETSVKVRSLIRFSMSRALIE